MSAAEPDAGTVEEELSSASAASCRSSANCKNCVFYARCRQPRLPTGLTTFRDKMRIKNSSRPRAGCVAIIKTRRRWGHVAYVTSVRHGTIRIDEGNWRRGRCSSRSGTERSLNIKGYFCP
jgi:hypothetical protein